MPRFEKIFKYAVILFGVLASLFWLATLQQPLIDQHEFRQTQTALTALFLQPDLHSLLNYETPVLGHPWIIPFEFPLYQWLASLPPRLLPIPLSASGRLISILFGLGCLWPSLAIMRRFEISVTGQRVFILLYLTSSIYLYWNRSFMIESTALFFTLTSLLAYTNISRIKIQDGSRSRSFFSARSLGLHSAFAITLSLGLLIKATTALPAFLLIGLDLAGRFIASLRAPAQNSQRLYHGLLAAASLAIGFLMLRAWTHHADALKELNPIGKYITSKSLQQWNFGQLSQRFSAELWDGVLIQRMLTPWGVLPAIGLLALGCTTKEKQQQKLLITACLFLALSPLLIFTNLHIEHNYYQSANQIYMLAALAAASSLCLESDRNAGIRAISLGLIVIFVIGSLQTFYTTSRYFNDAFSKESVKLDIGRLIQSRTPSDSVILVFDDDWSSAFAFHSKRRSLTAPEWFRDVESRGSFLSSHKEWMGSHPLGAVVSKQLLTNEEEMLLKDRCAAFSLWRYPQWNVYLCQAGGSAAIPQAPQ